MQTPRPTLDVINVHTTIKGREKAFKNHLKQLVNISPQDKLIFKYVLSTFRRRQTRMLGEKDEDPDPYNKKYIFYCLQKPCKD